MFVTQIDRHIGTGRMRMPAMTVFRSMLTMTAACSGIHIRPVMRHGERLAGRKCDHHHQDQEVNNRFLHSKNRGIRIILSKKRYHGLTAQTSAFSSLALHDSLRVSVDVLYLGRLAAKRFLRQRGFHEGIKIAIKHIASRRGRNAGP